MDHIARTTKDLGQALRAARKAKGVWQRTVSNIETGASGAKLDTIFDLLAALDLELRIVPRSKMSPRDLEDIF